MSLTFSTFKLALVLDCFLHKQDDLIYFFFLSRLDCFTLSPTPGIQF